MTVQRVDFTAPETAKLAASLPFYGQAALVLRSIDPLWKLETGEPREWEVLLEKWHGCDCCYCEPETKSVRVETETAAEAQEVAERDFPEWEVSQVRAPYPPFGQKPSLSVPDWFYDAAFKIAEARASDRGLKPLVETRTRLDAKHESPGARQRNRPDPIA